MGEFCNSIVGFWDATDFLPWTSLQRLPKQRVPKPCW